MILYFTAGFATGLLSVLLVGVFLGPQIRRLADEVKSEVEADITAMHRKAKSNVLQELEEEVGLSDKQRISLKEVVEKLRAEIEIEAIRKLQAALEESCSRGEIVTMELGGEPVTVTPPGVEGGTRLAVHQEVDDAR